MSVIAPSFNLGFNLALCLIASAGSLLAEAPKRVVSVNLCTDQMAMLLADPEELISVSFLARDKNVSALAEAALLYEVNHGALEEIVSLKPDLVLAHEWTSHELLAGLARSGIEVASFSTPASLDDISQFITAMGAALGKEADAEKMAGEYQGKLQRLRALEYDTSPPKLLTYGPNGWVSGSGNISAEAIELAGFDFAAGDYGFEAGGFMPLEVLVSAQPDIVLTSALYPGASRAETIMAHPALRSMDAKIYAMQQDQAWGCGLPLSLDGVYELVLLREKMG